MQVLCGLGQGLRLPRAKDAEDVTQGFSLDDASVVYFYYFSWRSPPVCVLRTGRRLPDTNPVNGSSYNYGFSYDGSTDRGYNISAPGSAYPNSVGSEMAYMFYVELGNLGYRDTAGNPGQSGWGLNNTGPFTNLQSFLYWSGTEYAPSTGNAWYFNFISGYQDAASKNGNNLYAWAVRPGDASTAVPEPTTIALLGIGLAGMGVYDVRRRRRRG